jgi:hypothetical protein
MHQTLDSEISECYLHAAGAIAAPIRVAIGLQGKIFSKWRSAHQCCGADDAPPRFKQSPPVEINAPTEE